jgi:hypothetical protein
MMRYGQFCPIAKAAEIVGEMLAGSTHFSDIRRGAQFAALIQSDTLDGPECAH